MRPWHRAGIWLSIAMALLGLVWLTARSQAVAGPSLESAGASAEPAAVLVRVGPPDQTVAPGEQFAVAVEIAGLASPLSAFQFDLGYNPALVRPAGTSPGAFLSSTGRMIICPEPAYPNASTVRIACAGAGGASGPTGSGVLVTLTFVALDVGTSPLTLSALQLPGGGIPPMTIPATAQGGQVTIVPAPEGQSIYLPLILRAH